MSLSSSFRTARVMTGVNYALMLEYRAEILLWMLAGILPLILMGLWIQMAQSGSVGGFSAVDFARYFFAVFLARQLTVVWMIWEFEQQVVDGTLSNALLQPIDPVFRHIYSHMGERLTRLPILLAFIGIFFLLYPSAAWWPGTLNIIWFLLIVHLAFALRFVIQYTFALLSFWVERAGALEQMWFLLYLFFSGLIAPLEFYPEALRNVIQWTPFPYLIYLPAKVLMGDLTGIPQGCTVMCVWFIGFYALNRFLWRKGLQRYSGMGA
jgi:ABC-2 type transport system permease protein